jgi:hypothetical protein
VRISILSLVAFVLSASFAHAQAPVSNDGPALVKGQNFIEMQNRVGGEYVPTFDGLLRIKGTDDIHTDAWFLVTKGWAAVMFGPSVRFRPGFGTSLLIGMETGKGYWRINPNFWYFRGRFGTIQAYELGASGYWYKSTATWAMASRLRLGVHSQRLFDQDGGFNAGGPTVEFDILPGKTLWASTLWGDGKNKSIVGLITRF